MTNRLQEQGQKHGLGNFFTDTESFEDGIQRESFIIYSKTGKFYDGISKLNFIDIVNRDKVNFYQGAGYGK